MMRSGVDVENTSMEIATLPIIDFDLEVTFNLLSIGLLLKLRVIKVSHFSLNDEFPLQTKKKKKTL